MFKKNFKFFLVVVFICTAIASYALAYGYEREKIISFDSNIRIHKDSSMTVTETIKVFSQAEKIQRGIYRDFPTKYKDRYGNNYVVDFSVNGVLKNGLPEKFKVENLNNGKRVYIGSAGSYLAPGEYVYTLIYTTNRQLGFFKDSDELYWNVTGNGWVFEIDSAKAVVELPEGARVLTMSGYTGPQGSRQSEFISRIDYQGRAVFESTRLLNPYEGLTIVVTWPKGYVNEPALGMKIYYIIRDNGSAIIGIIGLLILLMYYFIVWYRFGKDPQKGVIIPLFDPPYKLLPVAMRYIMKMGFDHKSFAVHIINMAVKGYIIIEEDSGSYVLRKTGKNESVLERPELVTAGLLFKTSDEIELKNKNYVEINYAIKNLQDDLKIKYENKYFFSNIQYFIPGVLISILSIFIILVLQTTDRAIISLFMSAWVTFWSFGVYMLLRQVFSAWKGAMGSRFPKGSSFAQAVFLSMFSVPFVFGEIIGLSMLFHAASAIIISVLAGLISLNIIFYYLLKAPTFLGRKAMDKIEGFKLYLSVAEKERLNILNPPEKTPELFEKYLPFALALDIEQAWAEQFSEVFAKFSASGRQYTPLWYSGPSWNNFGAGGFCSGLSNSFSSAISSSSVAPGSASGGGGGGSSGGGGGGGGGGGW